jgi:hypothetical protein
MFEAGDAYLPALDQIANNAAAKVVMRGTTGVARTMLEYDDSGDIVRVIWQGAIPTTYNPLFDIDVNVWWAPDTADSVGNVNWVIDFERMNVGEDVTSNNFAGNQQVVSPAGPTNEVVKATRSFTQAQADGLNPGDPFRIRLFRTGGSGNDTMVGSALVLRVTLEPGALS